MDARVVSIGALAVNDLWNERQPRRTGHATTTVVRTGEATIVVDPGLPAPALRARLAERLNLAPERVTHVFLTSFRPDTWRGIELFANAEWLIAEAEREAAGVPLARAVKELALERRASGLGSASAPGSSAAEPPAGFGLGPHADGPPGAGGLDDDDPDGLGASGAGPGPGRVPATDPAEAVAQIAARELAVLQRCRPAPDRVADGVDLFPLPGVTAGLTGLLVGGRQTLLITGDAIATQDHLEQGKVAPPCHDADLARESFAEAVEIADLLVLGRDNLLMNPVKRPF